MENAYGIGITNRFGCFLRRASSDSDDDGDDVWKASEVSKPKVKTAEKENQSEKLNKTASDKSAPRKGIRDRDSNVKGSDANKISNRSLGNSGEYQKSNRPRSERGFDKERGVKFNEDEREERNNRRNREEGVRSEIGEYDRRGPRGGGFRGDRRGGSRGGRGGPRKREFDRQSGSDKSGVKPIDKRDGQGPRNWGTYKDEIEAEAATHPGEEISYEKIEKDNVEEKTGEKTEGDDAATNGPQEPKLMTLEEWKALQQPRQKPVFNLRKAGEGEDQSQWQNLTLKKKEKVEQDEEEYEEEEEYDCPQRSGRQKQILEIDFHFADSRRGGAGSDRRGGRGSRDRMDRGDRGRGGSRGFRREGGGFRGGRGGREDRPTRQAAPRVDDVNDFPSLG